MEPPTKPIQEPRHRQSILRRTRGPKKQHTMKNDPRREERHTEYIRAEDAKYSTESDTHYEN